MIDDSLYQPTDLIFNKTFTHVVAAIEMVELGRINLSKSSLFSIDSIDAVFFKCQISAVGFILVGKTVFKTPSQTDCTFCKSRHEG